MSNVIPMPQPVDPQVHPVTAQAMGDLNGACSDVRHAITEATSMAEAWAIYEHCKAMRGLLDDLVKVAQARCYVLLEDV